MREIPSGNRLFPLRAQCEFFFNSENGQSNQLYLQRSEFLSLLGLGKLSVAMVDLAKSSATAISTAPDKSQKAKPEKPDEQLYKDSVQKAEREHAAAQEKVVRSWHNLQLISFSNSLCSITALTQICMQAAIKAKIDSAQPSNKDSPAGKKQKELRSQLQQIQQQQSGFRSSRTSVQEKIAALDTQLKSRDAEQKVSLSRVRYKNVGEIDRVIQRLEEQVDAGTMKLVDEKKALAEISALRKQRKAFGGIDEAQKGIEDLKSQIKDLRKTLDNPESKALSQKYDEINRELQEIKAEQDKAYAGLSALRDERSKLYAEQQEKYSAVKEIKDEYFKARTAYRDYEQDQYRQRQERQKAEREAYQKERRRKIADKKLEEASEPAYVDEILAAEGLIRYFDPSSAEESKALRAPSGFAAEAQRSVDGSGIKGTKVARKEDREENYFMGTGGKKGKRGRNGNAGSAPAHSNSNESKFNLTVGIIEQFAKISIEPPMNQSDVAGVLEKLKEKRDQWRKDQESKTKEV